ncbi:Protein prenyltransferase alpha subunit repeat-containing protein 1 [Haplosporangium gracile]|nr:Protein prenyltransferase alpha subunit repeat-containing protein 1 [Haplosporangium gracile]
MPGCLSAEDEIRFLNTVLTFPRNCKSSGAWHHRKWLLCFLHKDHNTVPLDPLVVERQLKICQEAAERYPKCYYAWTMRHWLVEHLGVHWWKASLARHETPVAPAGGGDGSGVSDAEQQDDDYYLTPMEREFERMKNHMQRNVSDHSGQQHLQQCMIQLSGQWIVQRKVQESMSNVEVALQWTRKELASRRQRRRIVGTSHRRMKQQVRKESQEEEKKEMQGRAQTGSRLSAIRSQVQDLSLFSVVSSSAAITDGSDEDNGKQGEEEQSLLALARASFPWVVRLWVSELERTRDMVRTYPGHESLWYHLRFMYYGVCWLDSETELLPGSGDVGDNSDCIEDRGENEDVEEEEQGGNVEEEGDEWFVSLASERAFAEGLLTGIGIGIGIGEDEAEEAPEESDPEKLQRALADKYIAWVERLDLGCQLP